MIPIRIFADEHLISPTVAHLEAFGFEKVVPVDPITEVESAPAPVRIVVNKKGIKVMPDWFNNSLPVLFPGQMPNTREHLLTLVMFYSGLTEDALNMSKDTELNELITEMIFPSDKAKWLESFFSGHDLWHNRAVLEFYMGVTSEASAEELFKMALEEEVSSELKAYSAWHYSIFLQDRGNNQEAYDLLTSYVLMDQLEEAARKALQFEQIRCLKELKGHQMAGEEFISYKALIWEVYSYYRGLNATLLEAQLCREMALVAQMEESFSEALGYINKCIHIYLAEQLPEMEADAYMLKGMLLHQWAKTGAPQFFQQSINSYQKALHVFKQESTPHLFAHIHHQLGVLYAEMPEENQKRALWAAVSATSFKEALQFYSADNFPWDYAMVCHNYATALMKYPDAVRSDNVAKAIGLFEEALKIRTEDAPHERCVSLLNYLEASWEAENVNDVIEKARIQDMRDKALEAFSLAPNEELKDRARQHLDSITQVLEEVTV